jgi:uncharacterized protein YjbI with pentapeptide repeats
MAWEDLPESTRSRLEDLFDCPFSSCGTINSPTLNGLLLLINEGSDIWNAWAELNPNFHADFSRHTFTEPTSFSGFIFPSGSNGRVSFKKSVFQKPADFSNCTFPQKTSFEDAKFLAEASLKECKFSEVAFKACEFHAPAEFDKSLFLGNTKFKSVKFVAFTSFEGSKFLQNIDLHSIEAYDDISFERCQFLEAFDIRNSNGHGKMNFSHSEFFSEFRFVSMKNFDVISNEAKFHKQVTFWKNETSGVRFSSSTFISKALFTRTKFEGENFFNECRFESLASFHSSAFPDAVEFDLSEFRDTLSFSCPPDDSDSNKPKDLKYISFSGCQFHGAAKFDNRNFTSKSKFSKKLKSDDSFATTFHKAPTFHGCKFHQDTSFHGAIFIQDYGDEAAKAYRTLKLAFEQLKSTREEQRFFKHEMQAERPDLTSWKWLFSWTYGLCSDYGFSIWRPLVTLLALSIAISAAHGVIANAVAGANWKKALSPEFEHIDSKRTLTAAQYVLINTIPAPGIDKTQQKLREDLFKTETSPSTLSTAALFLEFIHKFIALLCVFLSGLAVRNLLKMKS